MNKAIEFAKEIVRKEMAISVTKSDKLKRDYSKSIKESTKDLRYYCKCRCISFEDVMKTARSLVE